MTCDKCPNMSYDGKRYNCSLHITESGEQRLSKHTLVIKVLTKSRPAMCDMGKDGVEVDLEAHDE